MKIFFLIPSGRFGGSCVGLILAFAGNKVFGKSNGIKGFDGMVKSEAAAKINPPVTKYEAYVPMT